MTRFQQEISGALGEYWAKSAEKDIERAIENARENAITDLDGAIKWKSNGKYLMDDICEMLEYAGYPFSRIATKMSREVQVEKDLEEYRNKWQEPSDEEKAEMRNIFGSNTEVFDIVVGRSIQL